MSGVLKLGNITWGTENNGNIDLTNVGYANITSINNVKVDNPMFSVYLATNSTTYSDATQTVLPFDTVDIDTHSGYSLVNNNFTCPTGYAGKYVVGSKIFVGNTTDTNVRDVYYSVRKNGVLYDSYGIRYGTNDAGIGSGATMNIIELSEGDTLDLYVYCNTSDGSAWYFLYSGRVRSTDFPEGLRVNSFFGYRIQ